jgi:hypothetical protein
MTRRGSMHRFESELPLLKGLLENIKGGQAGPFVDPTWTADLDLSTRTIIVRRLKGSDDRTRYLERDEVNALRGSCNVNRKSPAPSRLVCSLTSVASHLGG